MNPQSDIITGINEFDTLALHRDTAQRLNELFSSIPDIQQLPQTTQPQIPFGQYGIVSPGTNINLSPEEILRMKHVNEFKTLNKNNQFFGEDIFVRQDDTKRYLDEDYGFRIDRDNEDFYAGQQGAFSEITKSIFMKLPAYTLTKLGTGIGYLLGLANPINWFEDNYIAAAGDNLIANAFSDLEDNLKNDWLTSYQEAADRDKGFFSRAFTDLNFWTEDVVDGAAFLASAFIPAGLVSKLGLGTKLASGLGATRALKSSSDLIRGLGANSLKYGDQFLATAVNTASESMWEAKQVRDKVYNDLISSGQYTEKEARDISGDKARNTFLTNMGMLGFSNAWETNLFFKALRRTRPGVSIASTNLAEDYVLKSGRLLNSKAGFYINKALQGIGVEGFYEENMQLAIQRINDGTANYGNIFSQFLNQTRDALSGEDKEAAESIGLGAIIGGLFGTGISMVSKDYTRGKAESQIVVDALNKARNNWIKAGDIYYKDEDGKWKMDNKKASSILFSQFNNAGKLEDLENAVDPIAINVAKKDLFASFVSSHIKNGSFDKLITQLQSLGSLSPEQLIKMGFDPEQNSLDQIAEYINFAHKVKAARDRVDRVVTVDGKDTLRKEMLFESSVRGEALKDELSKLDSRISKLSTNMTGHSSTDPLVESLNLLKARILFYKDDPEKADKLEKEVTKLEKDNESSLKNLKKGKDGFYLFENDQKNQSIPFQEYIETLVKKADLQNALDEVGEHFEKVNSNKDGFVDKIYEEQTKQVEEAIQKFQEKQEEEKKQEEKKPEAEVTQPSPEEQKELLGIITETQDKAPKPQSVAEVKALEYDDIKNEIQKNILNLVSGKKGIHMNAIGNIGGIIKKSYEQGKITEQEHDYLIRHMDTYKMVGTPFDTDEDAIAEDNSIGQIDPVKSPEIVEPKAEEPAFVPPTPAAVEVQLEPQQSMIAFRSSLKTVTQEESEDDNGFIGTLNPDPYIAFKQKFLRTLLKNGNFEDFAGVITKDKPEYPHDERAQSHINATGQFGSVLTITNKEGQPIYFDKNYNFTTEPKEGSQLLVYSFTKDYWKDIEELRAMIGALRMDTTPEQLIEQYQEEERQFTAARELNNQGKDVPVSFDGMSAGALRKSNQSRPSSTVLDRFRYSLMIASTLDGQFVPTFENRNLINGALYAVVQDPSEPDVYVRITPNKVINVSEIHEPLMTFMRHKFKDEQSADDVAQYLHGLLYLGASGRPSVTVQPHESGSGFKLVVLTSTGTFEGDRAIEILEQENLNPEQKYLQNNIFPQLYLEDGIVKSRELNYEEFLIKNSSTTILPILTEQGPKIRYLNTYLIFKIDKSSGQLTAELNGEQAEVKPREDKPVVPPQAPSDSKTLTGEPLKKRKKITEVPDETKIDEATRRAEEERKRREDDLFNPLQSKKTAGIYEPITDSEIAHVNKLFGQNVVERLSDIANSDSWATWTTSGIKLYADAPIGTGYHEAWHHFSQLYLTKAQKRSLYDEVRVRHISFTTRDGRKLNTREASDIDIEEFVADDFRDYVLGNGKSRLSNRPHRNTIFRKILDFIKEFFFGRVNVEKLYRELLSGQLNQYRPSIDNAFWGKLNAAIQTKDGVEIFNNQKSSYYRGVIDVLMGQELLRTNHSIDTLQTDRKIAGILYERVRLNIHRNYYDPLYNKYDAGEEYNISLLDDLEKLLENWQNVVEYHRKHNKLGYFIEDELPEIDIETADDYVEEAEETALAGEEATTIDEIRNTDKLFDIQGNEKASFDYAYLETKYLIRMLPKVIYEGGQFKVDTDHNGFPKLNEFSRTWNNVALELEGMLSYSNMYRKLQDPQVQAKIPEVTELIKMLPPPDKVHNTSEINRITKFYQDFNKSYVGVYSGTLVSEQKTNFYFTEETKRNRDLILRIWSNNFLSITADSDYFTSDYIIYNESEDRFSLNPNKILNFDLSRESGRKDLMQLIGIKFSEKTLSQPEVRRHLRNYLTLIQDNINNRHKIGEILYNPIIDIKKDVRGVAGLGGIIDALARVEAKFTSETPSLSYQTAEGQMIYGLMLNNFLTTSAHILNSVSSYESIKKSPASQHLNVDNNPYVKNSVFLNTLFDLNTGERRQGFSLILGNYNGLKVTGDFNMAGSTTSLNPRQKLILDFNSLLTRGAIDIMRTESSASSYFLKLSSYKNGTLLPVALSSLQSGFRTSEFMKIMEGYLEDELNRMKTTDTLKVNGKIIEAAKQFNLFRDILNKSSIKEKLKDKIREEIKTKDVKKVIDDNIDNIQDAIVNFFDREAASFKELLDSENVTENDIDSTIHQKEGDYSNLNQLVRAFVANDFVLNVEYTKLISGDLIYQADYKDYFKRSKGDVSTGRRPLVEQFVANYMKSKEKLTMAGFLGYSHLNNYNYVRSASIKDNEISSAYVDSGVLEKNIRAVNPNISDEELNGILDKYRKTNVADGQGHITLDFYRQFLISIGNWNWNTQELTYQYEMAKFRVENSDKGVGYTEEDFQKDLVYISKRESELAQLNRTTISYFPPLKIQYNGPIAMEGTYAPLMDKFSVAPLIPSLIKGTKWEKINIDLVKNGIGYTKFESGTKKYKPNAVTMYHPDGSVGIDFTDYTPTINHLIYLKEQINTNPDIKTESIFGSQVRKLVLANMFDKGLTSEKWMKRYERYKNILDSHSTIERNLLLEDLGIERTEAGGIVIKDMKKFVTVVQRQADERDLNDNIKDYIQYDKDTKTFRFPLEASLNRNAIQDMLMGMIDRSLRRQKVNGDMLIQISSSGFESADFSYTKPTEDQVRQYGSNGLKFYELDYVDGKPSRTRAMQVKVGLNGGFEKLLLLNHPDGNQIGTRERLNTLLKDEEWMNTHRNFVTMVGYRIPTQGINSIEFMEIAEFLPPVVGSSIIVPAEIVVKSGSDFDIDKLSVFRPSFDENGRLIENKQLNPSLEKGRLTNGIISLFSEVLSDPEMFMQLITPNNNDKIKPLSVEIAEAINRRQTTYQATQVLRYKNNLRKFESLLSAKRLLGIFAVNNTFSQLLQQNGVNANLSYGRNRQKTVKLLFFTPAEKQKVVNGKKLLISNRHDVEGNLKQDYFSQLINATVDIASDDYIGYVNLSYENAGVLSWMINMGVPLNRAMWFLNQPVLLKYYFSLRSNAGEKKKNFIQAEILESLGVKGLFENKEDGRKSTKQSLIDDAINKILADPTIPDNFYFGVNTLKQKVTRDYQEAISKDIKYQRLVFAYFLSLQQQANAFREFQGTLNFDTTKFQTVIDAVKSIRNEEAITDPRKGMNNLFDRDELNKIANNSIISSFNNKKLIYSILSSIMPAGSDANFLIKASNSLDSIFGNRLKQRASRAMANDWIEFIVKNMAEYNNETMRFYYFSLLQGKNSLARRLIQMKRAYPELVREYNIFDRMKPNLPTSKDIRNQNVQVDRLFENTTDDQNSYIEQFRTLISFNDPTYNPEQRYEITSFFKDVALIAFLQSGFSKSNISFQELVPYEQFAEIFTRALNLYGQVIKGNPELRELFTRQFFTKFADFNPTLFGKVTKGKQHWRGKPYFIDTFSNEKLGKVLPKGGTPTPLSVTPIEPTKPIRTEGTIDFQEEQSSGYRNRTIKNASADATIAFAVDFTTAGEKLTKTAAKDINKKLYMPVDANNFEITPERIKKTVDKLNSVNAKTLNIAGNGIYTMKGKYSQDEVDEFTYQYLKAVIEHPDLKNKIESIRTGGQTGFDEAGAKAGVRLGIPTSILAPKGWKFRDASGKDISDEQAFKARFRDVVMTTNFTPQELQKFEEMDQVLSKATEEKTREDSLERDIKKAEEQYLKDWLENNPRYYVPIPKEYWKDEKKLDEYFRKPGVRITADNLSDALEQNKVLGDQITDNKDPNKGGVSSILNSVNDYIDFPTGKSSSSDSKSFRHLIDEYNNDEFTENEKPFVKDFLTKYGLAKYIGVDMSYYNPNQLSLFPEESQSIKVTDYQLTPEQIEEFKKNCKGSD